MACPIAGVQIIRTHDALFRFVFGEPEQMAEMLRACLAPEVVAAIDWSTLRREDTTFVDETLRDRQADLLFTARLGDAEALLYVLAEHKSHEDRLTAWQLARYVVRVLDRWLAGHPAAMMLPAVLPFVLHHGDRPWQGPRSPHELVDLRGCADVVAARLRPMQMHLPFVLLDLAAASEASIEGMRVSAVTGLTLRFLQFLRQQRPQDAATAILGWRHLLVQLLDHPRGQDVLVALLSWWFARSPADPQTLRTVMAKIHEENPPMRSLLDLLLEMGEKRGLEQGLQQGMQQGMQQGRQQGLLAGQRTLLATLLRQRFGELSAAVQARLDGAEALALQAWGRRLLAATSLDDVFAGS